MQYDLFTTKKHKRKIINNKIRKTCTPVITEAEKEAINNFMQSWNDFDIAELQEDKKENITELSDDGLQF